MDEYELGTAVALDFTWKTDSDDDGALDDPTDPTTVEFQVEKPDGTLLTYAFPDVAIENPSTGRYVLTLTATVLDLAGEYPFLAIGTGDAEAVYEGVFRVNGNAIDSPSEPPATQGVCGTWVDADALLRRCSGASWGDLEPFAYGASELLYYASGQRYPGACSATVRPCSEDCSCRFQVTNTGHIIMPPSYPIDCLAASCCEASEVWLAGYPVRRVTAVLIDGEELADDEYRLDQARRLVRTDGARWPGCQDRSLANDAVGAFTIEYEYGADPPASGVAAALALATELWRSCPGVDGDCQLPAGVTRVTRQGVAIEMNLVADLLNEGKTGIAAIDGFLAVFGTAKMPPMSAVWSPDVPGFAQPVG